MFEAKKQLNLVKEKLATVDDSYNRLGVLNNEISGLDYLIGGQTKKPENVQHEILDFISSDSLEVNIVSIADVHLYKSDEFLIYSNEIELSGSYENLVNTLYNIETNFKNSRVMSSQFYSKKNYKTNKQNLFLKIILQNYEKAK